LFGRNGNDTLEGGPGADTLTGGRHADVFIFARKAGADRITDFSGAEGDRLHLRADLFGTQPSGATVVSRHASVTSQGVLLDFGGGDSILLQGLRSTTGLADWIEII
jgi:Ca2+-binding RTX toxin-like protein